MTTEKDEVVATVVPAEHELIKALQQPTLRDQFAMAALPAIITATTGPNGGGNVSGGYSGKIKLAYAYADAAMKFRSSNGGAMESRYGKKKRY